MSYKERIELYGECEKLRQKPLIVYVTSIRPNISSQMSVDSLTSIHRIHKKRCRHNRSVTFNNSF